MGREENYKNTYDTLSKEEIVKIFHAFLNCPCGSCDGCILDSYEVGCFKLRDMAMQKVVDIFGGGDNGYDD